ncbi:MAG: cation acetate symporter [Proteobacteria bacterium]|nr:cation acetate symporter [Pseudomonadota bacterium]
MIRLLLCLAALLVPGLALAQEAMKTYQFVPSGALSTLGLIYTVAMVVMFLWVGWLSKKRVATSDDFYTAGRGIGALSNGLAMTSNYMSLATFLGFTALLWKLQFLLVAFVMSWLAGFVMVSVSVAPSLRRWGKFTSMQFIGERYGHTAKVISVICMILLAQLYLVGQMKGIGNVFQVMFHWDYTTGLIVGGLVVTAYVTIGGMYGLSYNQTLQAVIMGIAILLPTAMILWKLNAGPASVFPPFGYSKLVPEMVAALPTYFDPFTTVGGKIPLSFKYYTAIVLSLAMGTIGLPHIAMRYFTAPSVRDGKVATLWGIFFIGIVFFTTFAIGFAAKLYTMQVLNAQGLAIDPKEADLLVVVMSQAFTPAWIAALPIAGALAAGMSTIGGLLMVIGTGIGHDIYSTLVPNADDHKKVKMGLFFTAFGGLVTILLALKPPDFLLTSVIWAYVVSASTFTPVLILGIWWKGANRAGAISGMTLGGILSVWLWWTKGDLLGLQVVNMGPLGQLVCAIFTASAAWFVTVAVSLLTGGERDERILREVDRIHGWRDYHPERYNGKLFPVSCAVLALALMVWSAMPDAPPKAQAAAPAPVSAVVAQK